MYRIKEKIIFLLIIIITIVLAFMPMIIDNININKEVDLVIEESNEVIDSNESKTIESTIETNLIYITLTGEVKEERTITIPYGYTYGYIMSKNKYILNSYSVIEEAKKLVRYYEDTVLYIGTTDIDLDNTITGLVNINSASKDELVSLYGIGTKRAERIITYRNTNTIDSFEELKEVIEVSDEIIEVLKEQAIL